MTCYEGWHLVYLTLASVCGVVYCSGIPLLVFIVTTIKNPLICHRDRTAPSRDIGGAIEDHHEPVEDAPDPAHIIGSVDGAPDGATGAGRGTDAEAATKVEVDDDEEDEEEEPTCFSPTVRCKRRSAADYERHKVRVRFGFLFHGYETDRPAGEGGMLVAGWETCVMLRKLLVTLAGAIITDPYLQVIAALMILIISFGMQSFLQPYDPIALDILDSVAQFCLLCTQILSILYLYVDTASAETLPGVNKVMLEYVHVHTHNTQHCCTPSTSMRIRLTLRLLPHAPTLQIRRHRCALPHQCSCSVRIRGCLDHRYASTRQGCLPLPQALSHAPRHR